MNNSSQTNNQTTSSISQSNTSISDPYAIHQSSSPTVVLVQPELSSDNYALWSHAMIMALRAKKKCGFVDGTISKPSTNSPAWAASNDFVSSCVWSLPFPKFAQSFYMQSLPLKFGRILRIIFSNLMLLKFINPSNQSLHSSKTILPSPSISLGLSLYWTNSIPFMLSHHVYMVTGNQPLNVIIKTMCNTP